MLKNILKFNGVQQLNKQQQKVITGASGIENNRCAGTPYAFCDMDGGCPSPYPGPNNSNYCCTADSLCYYL